MDSKQYISALERHGKEQYKMYAPYRVKVPLGKKGKWIVRQFETEMGIGYLRLARDGRPPGLGKFTALNYEDYGMIMSDTRPEVDDVRAFAYLLRGHVLITGLGLGMVPHMLTKVKKYSDNVLSLTIVEVSKDVIALTGDHYRKSDERISIVHADAKTWTPPKGTKYDAAWHDIWPNICEDNRAEMSAIRRHYQRYVRAGQQFCWGQVELDRQRARRY
jgi:hypothetical protein